MDERLWRQLPAETKATALKAISCDIYRDPVPPTISGDPPVAYGFHTGRRLAMLTSVGVNFEQQ